MGNKEISSSSDASFVYDLIGRILPLQKDDFLLEKLPSSSEIFFELSCLDNKIRIQGNDNVSLAYGFNYYLRYYLNTSISWCGNNVPQPPKLLPLPLKTIKQISSFPYFPSTSYCFLYEFFPFPALNSQTRCFSDC